MSRTFLLWMATIGVLTVPLSNSFAIPKTCSRGKVNNAFTQGHCCWEGQTWAMDEGRCIGMAECPMGLRPTSDGEDCIDAQAQCEDGRIRSGDGCCWPQQRWNPKTKLCVGRPKCPTGRIQRASDCVALPPRPRQSTLPYKPVDEADYVQLKPGAFTQGSPRREFGRYRNERAYTVALSRFLLFKRTEVTQGEWRQLIPHNPSYFSKCGDDCPVERVNWYEALEWVNRLSQAEGLDQCYRLVDCRGELGGGCRLQGESESACQGDYQCASVQFVGLNCNGYRLPTEAEWEYAARAGTTEATHAGPIGPRKPLEGLHKIAWFNMNSQLGLMGLPCSANNDSQLDGQGPKALCGTHPVAQKQANPWKIYDMHGNVMEWVWDAFGTYPVKSKLNPRRDVGLERGIRGGHWQSEPLGLRAAMRGRMGPVGRNARLGFRTVRTIPPPQGAKGKKAKGNRESHPEDIREGLKMVGPPAPELRDGRQPKTTPTPSRKKRVSRKSGPPPGKPIGLTKKSKKKPQKSRHQKPKNKSTSIKLKVVP